MPFRALLLICSLLLATSATAVPDAVPLAPFDAAAVGTPSAPTA